LSGTQIEDNQTTDQFPMANHKLVIYQLFTRWFGNTKSTNKFYGTRDENGVGKFNDITDKALQELAKFGITHVWYTGVLEHATLTDYSEFGIQPDHPLIVKGIAGSPYAVKDYYDVDPDLAVDVPNRMKEFEELIVRTHQIGLKAIIDFIPNHVARQYHSERTMTRRSLFLRRTIFTTCPNRNSSFRKVNILPSPTTKPTSSTPQRPQETMFFSQSPRSLTGTKR
jgi:pullulanase/glycogen debranching enzyme